MRRRARGFTLIEIAVAMAILAIGVVTLQQIYQGSLRLQSRAARQDMAVLRARMAMDEMLADQYVRVGSDCKDAGDYRVCTSRQEAPAAYGAEQTRDLDLNVMESKLYFLEVDVSWRDGAGEKTYSVKTLRMAAEPE